MRQLSTAYLVLNPNDPVLSKDLRLALALILDRAAVFPEGRAADQAWSLVPPWTKGALTIAKDHLETAQPRRDELALEALARAGVDDEHPVHLEFLVATTGTGRPAQSIVVQWRRLPGVEVDVVAVGWEEYIHRINQGRYQMILSGWLAAYNDPSAFSTSRWTVIFSIFARVNGQ